MNIKFGIMRYGQIEVRDADIDIIEVIRQEMEGTIASCGGFNDDAADTIVVYEVDGNKIGG